MDVGAVRISCRRGAMSEPSPTQAVNDRAVARAREEITRRTAEGGEFKQPPNTDLRDRACVDGSLSKNQTDTRGRWVVPCCHRSFVAHAFEHPSHEAIGCCSVNEIHSSPHDLERRTADGDTARWSWRRFDGAIGSLVGALPTRGDQHPRNKDLIALKARETVCPGDR